MHSYVMHGVCALQSSSCCAVHVVRQPRPSISGFVFFVWIFDHAFCQCVECSAGTIYRYSNILV